MAKKTSSTVTEEEHKQRIALARAIWRLEDSANNLPKDANARAAAFQEVKPDLLKKARKFEKNLKALGYKVSDI